ncbi:MAG: hypothetical protein M3Q07_22660 [Pseudobdellovibrionaceae bacterium]|nr:hypothetical protein [Pseudobdellovibrionaceae bacterium]
MKFLLPWLFFVLGLAGRSHAESSEENRRARHIEVQGHGGFSGIGVSVGIYLTDDCRLDLKWSRGDAAFMGFDEHSFKAEFQSFTANSLYYGFGLHHRKVRWNQSYSSVTTYADSVLERSSTRSNGVYFVVGNEWTMKNFVIGGEWFGVSQPFLRQTDNAYKAIATETEKNRSKRNMDDAMSMPALIGPSLIIGFSF